MKQRLVDFKKTLQDELKSAQQSESALIDVDTQSPFNYHPNQQHHNQANGTARRSSNQSAVAQPSMDVVNFQYLKHVIMKFLTCRDVSCLFGCSMAVILNIAYFFFFSCPLKRSKLGNWCVQLPHCCISIRTKRNCCTARWTTRAAGLA